MHSISLAEDISLHWAKNRLWSNTFNELFYSAVSLLLWKQKQIRLLIVQGVPVILSTPLCWLRLVIYHDDKRKRLALEYLVGPPRQARTVCHHNCLACHQRCISVAEQIRFISMCWLSVCLSVPLKQWAHPRLNTKAGRRTRAETIKAWISWLRPREVTRGACEMFGTVSVPTSYCCWATERRRQCACPVVDPPCRQTASGEKWTRVIYSK